MNEEEYRTRLTLWSMLVAPLALAHDIRHATAAVKTLLLSHEVIAISQDPLCVKGRQVQWLGDTETWTRPLMDGAMAVALINRGLRQAAIEVKWADIGLASQQHVRDLWLRANLGKFGYGCQVTVPGQGAALLKVSQKELRSESQ
jgi:alpha-galactosidase